MNESELAEALLPLIQKHGVLRVLQALSHAVWDIAENHVLPKNSGSRNSINYREWQRAALALSNIEGRVTGLPPYPPYHS